MQQFETKLLQSLYDKRIANDPELKKFYLDEHERVMTGMQIYDLRKKVGLTQFELAQMVNSTPKVIDDIEQADYENNQDEIINRMITILKQKLGAVGAQETIRVASV